MRSPLRRLAAKTPILGRALREIDTRRLYREVCREFGEDFQNDHVGRIDALGYRFPFCSPTGAYLRPSFRGRVYEPSTSAHLVDHFSDRPIGFIDIGAHFGFFSCLVARFNPGSRVAAFEPGPDAFEVLKKNFALNQIQGGAYALALSDEASSVPFKGVSMKVDAHQTSLRVATEKFDTWQAQSAAPFDVVKIDVHGSEGKVLFGMQHTLRRDRFALYLELHPDELLVGYSLAEIVALVLDSGFAMHEITEFRKDARYELVAVDADRRARLVDPARWTTAERRGRRMFFCEKP
ncbi:MAG: FkbM family methyltransferase [bacterium]